MVLYNYVDLHIIFLITYFLDQTLNICFGMVAVKTGVPYFRKPADTVDREIFMLKIILAKNFHGVKFLWFCLIHELF